MAKAKKNNTSNIVTIANGDAAFETLAKFDKEVDEMMNTKEMVNHPDHYKGKKYEVINIIEDYDLGFCLGNVVKYVLRCGKKDDAIQELKKAKWYLEREIKNREEKR